MENIFAVSVNQERWDYGSSNEISGKRICTSLVLMLIIKLKVWNIIPLIFNNGQYEKKRKKIFQIA